MTEQEELAMLLGDESKPIKFPNGLIGLEDWQNFVVVSHPAGGALQLLQSLDDNRMSFIVADPHQIDADFQLKLSQADVDALQYAGKPGPIDPTSSPLVVCCIISVQEEPFEVTANLLGPLVINPASRLGLQVVLAESSYSTHYPVVKNTGAEDSSAAVKQAEEV